MPIQLLWLWQQLMPLTLTVATLWSIFLVETRRRNGKRRGAFYAS